MSRSSGVDRWRAVWIIIRDVILSGLAVWGIIHEERSGAVHWELLVVYTTLLGVPTALNVWAIKSNQQSSISGGSGKSPSGSDSSPSLSS